MKTSSFRIPLFLLCVAVLLCGLSLTALASGTETEPSEKPAARIFYHQLHPDVSGFDYPYFLFDQNHHFFRASSGNTAITLTHDEGIGSLYMIFGARCSEYSLRNNDTGETIPCGTNGFIHEFIDLEGAFGTAPASVTLNFGEDVVKLAEICAYTSGEVPASVQKWESHDNVKMDLVLFSTHSDDEQLFFAGALPYYAAELDYNVLVVYLTDHHNKEYYRIHEALNGLWAVGVRTYPVFGEFPDLFSSSKEDIYTQFEELGIFREDLQAFVVEQLRKFQPLVVLAHDFEGEYGNGQHMVYAETVAESLEMAADSSIFPESAEAYGTWDTPKAYFHLYPENPIVMDWDQPLEAFQGKTAFEVTRDLGFPCHKSQYEFYASYVHHTKAANAGKHSPCKFGLYRSLVGADTAKNDFFENLLCYAEQERLAEEARLAEAERLAEEARLAEEKQAEAAKLSEQERLARQEEAQAAAAQAQAAEAAAHDRRIAILFTIGVTALPGAMLLLLKSFRKK